jgi:hypothetical protein
LVGWFVDSSFGRLRTLQRNLLCQIRSYHNSENHTTSNPIRLWTFSSMCILANPYSLYVICHLDSTAKPQRLGKCAKFSGWIYLLATSSSGYRPALAWKRSHNQLPELYVLLPNSSDAWSLSQELTQRRPERDEGEILQDKLEFMIRARVLMEWSSLQTSCIRSRSYRCVSIPFEYLQVAQFHTFLRHESWLYSKAVGQFLPTFLTVSPRTVMSWNDQAQECPITLTLLDSRPQGEALSSSPLAPFFSSFFYPLFLHFSIMSSVLFLHFIFFLLFLFLLHILCHLLPFFCFSFFIFYSFISSLHCSYLHPNSNSAVAACCTMHLAFHFWGIWRSWIHWQC